MLEYLHIGTDLLVCTRVHLFFLLISVPKAYKRPEFVEELRALLTEQGTVSLECKVVGVPTPVLRWFKVSLFRPGIYRVNMYTHAAFIYL